MDKKKPNYFIYFAAIFLNLSCLSTGISYSWTSSLIPVFESNDTSINPLDKPLTPTESGLLVALLSLGSFAGPWIWGFLVHRLGKKKSLLISNLPILVGHVLCAAASKVEVLFVARFLMGLSISGAWAITPGYLSEIAEPSNRGILNSFSLGSSCLGILWGYLVGPFLSVTWFSVVNVIPCVVFCITVYLFVPESPFDLVLVHQNEAAKRSLMTLRRSSNVEKELLEIERVIEENSKDNGGFTDILKNKGSLNGFIICVILMIFNTMTGVIIVVGYAQSIFETAGSPIPPAYSAILVGTVAFVATVVNSQVIDRLGRRPIIIISSIIAALSHTALGVYFHLQSTGVNVQNIGWLPIASVIMFTFFHHFALGSVPFLILGELLASNIKAVATTVCTTINFGLAFALSLVYPYIVEYLGIANAYFIFAISMVVCAVFCILKVPETKGKSFKEIFALLDKK
ncbi:facilitated trehalose transporter Tret1-like [Anthonomus grandis grandis]|uniref:facilitated trehalose transporter Tret1-like n=1 Tax=Anthonomus grandis grandis TaxID=2921223 RepID=UPI002165F16B|nr:facilitated trehalose transporter Tret1-like [Anthonomus grandis grandis]